MLLGPFVVPDRSVPALTVTHTPSSPKPSRLAASSVQRASQPVALTGRGHDDDDQRVSAANPSTDGVGSIDVPVRSIPALAQWAAGRFGDREAIVDGDRRISFVELDSLALQATRACIARGVSPGDRVAIWAPNSWEWIVAALGVLGAGGWLVPLNTRFKGDEAAYVLEKADVSLLFTVEGFLGVDYVAVARDAAPHLRALREPVILKGAALGAGAVSFDAFLATGDAVDPAEAQARIDAIGSDDVSDVIFTSGTTGRPKGVMLRHGPSLRCYTMFSEGFGLTEGDRYLIVNPFFHCFGYKAGWMACLLTGATAVPVAVLDVEAVLGLIERERISALPGPPTLFWSLLERRASADSRHHDLSSLRIAFMGAAAIPAELIRRVREELPFKRITTGYGLTECHALVSITRPDDPPEWIARWSAGVAFPGMHVRIVDAAGAPVPIGEQGEIMVSGFHIMSGYYDEPEQTAAAIEPDGWLHTGDIGMLSERGDIRITDRLKDIYISGGFNVSPAEVESVLLGYEGVSQVAVVGAPDERLGEVGVAFVIARPGSIVDASALMVWAREHMANFKVPRRVEIVEAFPLNATGKVLKGELRRHTTIEEKT